MNQKPIVVVQHGDADPPGTLGVALDRLGVVWECRHAGSGDRLPVAAGELSALVILGGHMNTHEVDRYPFLRDERGLLEDCLRAEVPVLGICLGAQQLALAAGGTVYKRVAPEIGWLGIDMVAADPLMAGITDHPRCLQWHDYSYTLPPGALRIAVRDDGEQVFRTGRCAWGVQFHPEVDAAAVCEWLTQDAARLESMRPGWEEEIRADTATLIGAYPDFCARLVGNFLGCGQVLPGR